MIEPVRFGIVACSGVAKKWFLPALRSSNKATLERVGSRDTGKARVFADEFRANKSGSNHDVIADPAVEAIYVSTPPLAHKEWVLKAAHAGKHVLCEKPAFPTFRDAQEALDTCASNHIRLWENYMFERHPQHEMVASLISTGRIGQPGPFRGEFTYPTPPQGDIRLNPELGGGVMNDSAAYPVVAALLHLGRRPISISCKRGWKDSVDGSMSLVLAFEDNKMAQIFVAFGAFYRSRYSILGTQGRIEVLRAYSVGVQMETAVTLETDAGEERFQVPPANQFQLLLESFCEEVRQSPKTPGRLESDLLLRHAIMDAARRSDAERRQIELSEYKV